MRNTRITCVFLVAAALATVSYPLGTLAQQSIGRTRVVVETVTGEIDSTRRRLAVRDNVFQDERIETALGSASIIRFVDETRLTLGPNARLVLDEAVFDPTPGRGAFVLSAVQGVFRFLSGGLDSSAYEITTPTASIGVRGTQFAGVVAPDGTTVVILQSPHEVTVRHRASGKGVTLNRHSDSTTAFPDGVLTDPGPAPGWARAMLQELDDLLRIDPVHLERDEAGDIIEASVAPPAAPLVPDLPQAPSTSPSAKDPVQPSPIAAPDKLPPPPARQPPPPEPQGPPPTTGEERALKRAVGVAAEPAQAGGLVRAVSRADAHAEGSRDHGQGGRESGQDGGSQSGRSETTSASDQSGQDQDKGGPESDSPNRGGDNAQAAGGGAGGPSRGGPSDGGNQRASGPDSKSAQGRGDRPGKGGGRSSGGKGKNRR